MRTLAGAQKLKCVVSSDANWWLPTDEQMATLAAAVRRLAAVAARRIVISDTEPALILHDGTRTFVITSEMVTVERQSLRTPTLRKTITYRMARSMCERRLKNGVMTVCGVVSRDISAEVPMNILSDPWLLLFSLILTNKSTEDPVVAAWKLAEVLCMTQGLCKHHVEPVPQWQACVIALRGVHNAVLSVCYASESVRPHFLEPAVAHPPMPPLVVPPPSLPTAAPPPPQSPSSAAMETLDAALAPIDSVDFTDLFP